MKLTFTSAIVLALLVSIAAIPVEKETKYLITANKSNVRWNAKKVTGEHSGLISIKRGYLKMNESTLTTGTVFMDMNSISCLDLEDEGENKKLVGHLKSDDFFSAQKYPESVFKIYKIIPIKDNEEYTHTLEGALTIKGYTNPLNFPVKLEMKKEKVYISGKTSVDRTKYNIKYGSGKFFEDLGDRMIYDEFTIDFKIVAAVPEN